MPALRKTAITVPEKLLEEVDRIAGIRGESRSAFIVRVLSVGVKARRDRDLRRRIELAGRNE